jgi:hypothetical protein
VIRIIESRSFQGVCRYPGIEVNTGAFFFTRVETYPSADTGKRVFCPDIFERPGKEPSFYKIGGPPDIFTCRATDFTARPAFRFRYISHHYIHAALVSATVTAYT